MNRSVRYVFLALLMLLILAPLQPLFAQVDVSVSFGPPALPVYEQPACPDEGYIWTPGYWAYDPDDGYYWVPGTWVLAPQVGYLWTPPWWGWGGGGYLFHQGYWGPHVGFYGGINYGFGYSGNGFEGGRWDGGRFFYNRAANNVNITNIHNTYNTTIINNHESRVSYNGGNGGITARPTAAEEAVAHERHIEPIASQMQHRQTARANPELRAAANHGKPPIAATDRPGAFSGHSVVAAREAGAPYRPAPTPARAETPAAAHPPTHASELQQHQVATPVSTGNARLDQKYQQQQQKLVAKQNQQHQQLQQQQQREDQRVQQQQARQQQNQAKQQQYQARQQQTEQRHQQQTQQMEQRHTQQTQTLQTRQQPSHGSEPSHNGGAHPR